MDAGRPSRTALRVAMHRAAHQLFDQPCVFDDPLALRLLDDDTRQTLLATPEPQRHDRLGRGLRAFFAVRSRFAEDQLARAVEAGVQQYVVLGAGLDTSAYRQRDEALRVFEVDHPDTQAWKRARLAAAGVAAPATLTYVPIDFERQMLGQCLRDAGFRSDQPTFFSWLGVVPYLTHDAVMAMLGFIATSMPRGSSIVFDYALAPDLMTPEQRAGFEKVAEYVRAVCEPWKTFFAPRSLSVALKAWGFSEVEDLGQPALNERYFAGRLDGLRVGGAAHLMRALV
jgi:methyltransferase (TIGR00027 family)